MKRKRFNEKDDVKSEFDQMKSSTDSTPEGSGESEEKRNNLNYSDFDKI